MKMDRCCLSLSAESLLNFIVALIVGGWLTV